MIFPRVLYECVSRAKQREVEVGFQHKSTNVMEEKKKPILQAERRGSLSGWGSLGLASGEDAALKLAHSQGQY